MKVPTRTSNFFVLLSIGMVFLIGIVFYKGSISDEQTDIIAQDAFLKLCTRLKMSSNEFEPLLQTKSPSSEKVPVFVWKNKKNPNCRIEVDVDRQYANARPTWICD